MSQVKSHDPFFLPVFNNRNCFLCGRALKRNKSKEHVFPKWLLSKYDLWDKTITLINGSYISYRYLTIPCCSQCNTQHLSKLERLISAGVEGGFQEFSRLDWLPIYQWMLKIYYGILCREMSLLADRSNPENGFIATKEFLERLHHLHVFMQSTRMPFEFAGFRPCSLLIMQIELGEGDEPFDYLDSVNHLTFAIRMGNIGIISCLEDNAAQEQGLSDYWNKVRGKPLYPIQFCELFSKVTYKASLQNRVANYLHCKWEGDNKVLVVSPPLQGYSTEPIWNEWDQEKYSKYLGYYLYLKYQIPYSQVYKKPNSVITFLEDESGNPRP